MSTPWWIAAAVAVTWIAVTALLVGIWRREPELTPEDQADEQDARAW